MARDRREGKQVGVLQIAMAVVVVLCIVLGIIVSLTIYQRQQMEQTVISVTKEDAVLKMTVEGEEDVANVSAQEVEDSTTVEPVTVEEVTQEVTAEENETETEIETEVTEEALTETTSSDQYVVIGDQNVNMRDGASMNAKVIDLLAPGMTVTVLGEEGEWCKISTEGQEGYVIKRVLKETK